VIIDLSTIISNIQTDSIRHLQRLSSCFILLL